MDESKGGGSLIRFLGELPAWVRILFEVVIPFGMWFLVRAAIGFIVRGIGLGKRLNDAGISLPVRRAIWGSIAALGVASYWDDVWISLGFPVPEGSWVDQALRCVQVFSIACLAVGLWDAGADRLRATLAGSNVRTARVVLEFTQRLGQFVLWTLGLLSVTYVLGYNVAGLVAGLGVGGVAVALAAKDSVENLFGALTIVMDRPFDIGDWVKIGEVDGTVETISLRSTRIRTFEDSIVTMPNATFIKANVENLGIRRERRVRLTLPFRHATSSAMTAYCDKLRQELGERPEIDPAKVRVALNSLGFDGAGVLIQCYLNVATIADEDQARQEVLLTSIRLAEENQLEILVR